MKYLISGGGTGGHIYPALAIASEIKRQDNKAEILYIGTEDSLESELVPKAGFDFKTVRVKGMPRKINKDFFLAIKELILGINDSRKILNEFKPDIVIGTGGYVCGPIVYMAKKKGVKALIHEQNAFPGITNKILSRYVDKVLVTFEESREYFKHPDRVQLTGNPIRREILEIDRSSAFKTLDMRDDIPLVLSFGGSGGQKSLNHAMYEVIKANNNSEDIQIIHVSGKRHYNSFMERLKDGAIDLGENIRVLPYLYEMPQALNIASLMITSAGAISLAEISALGIASILVPKGYTAENHQEYNAKAFEDKGAALVILEKNLDGEILKKEINRLIADPEKISTMQANSKKLGKVRAAEEIVEIIRETIGS